MLFAFALNCYLAINHDILGIPMQMYPIVTIRLNQILFVLTTCMLLCPLKIFNYQGRFWFLETIGRIILSGYQSVQFRDFFMSDLLSSMVFEFNKTYSFVAIETSFCVMVTYPNGSIYV